MHEKTSCYENHLYGFYAALLSFSLIWPIDTTSTRLRFYKKPIFESNINQTLKNYLDAISPNQTYTDKASLIKSFFNKGIYWGFSYHLIAGALTFPTQTHLKNYFLTHFESSKEHAILTGAFAGWIAAFFQLILLHPIDSMKVSAQKTPEIFNNNMKQYFLTKQPELRRGTGVVAIGSVSHFVAWQAKLSMALLLEDKKIDEKLKTMLSAMTFSITHMMIAYPVNTTKTWVQGDFSYKPRHQSFLKKAARTAEITRDHVKTLGPKVLYRGFFSRGCMHITSFSLTISMYDTLQKN